MTPLYVPKFTRRTLKFDVEDGDARLPIKAYHMRAEGNALVCAEGSGQVCPLPEGAVLVRNGEALVYAVKEFGELYRFNGETFASAGGIMNLRGAVSFVHKNGERREYAVSDAGIYLLEDTPIYIADAGGGASCVAVHYERLFAAKGYRVRYSKALEPENWQESEQGAGYLDLPSAGGDIVAMLPYKEKLYLFRERGITQLRALGDNLNFKAVTLPYACGKIAKESIASCGDKILFFTESGLFAFNGGVCALLTEYGAGRVDLTKPVSAVGAGGKYYAAVTLLSGERCIFCADPARKEGHFIGIPAENLVGGAELLFSFEGALYRLTASGAPRAGACGLEIGKTALGLSDGNKFLDAMLLEGEGEYLIEAFGENQSYCAAEGAAGERLAFNRPVRGRTFSLRITARSEGVALKKIIFAVREEDRFGY